MKKLFAFISLFTLTFAFAQIAIGKNSVTNNTSVSLEFGDYTAPPSGYGGGKGIIVPWVTAASNVTGAVPGTIIFDHSDMLFKFRGANSWKLLSKNGSAMVNGVHTDISGNISTSDWSVQTTTNGNAINEKPDAKTSIGSPSATPGILVLEDNNKAMILPKVADPHLNIINPAPGTMAYDTRKNQLAIFNGTVWSFWKP